MRRTVTILPIAYVHRNKIWTRKGYLIVYTMITTFVFFGITRFIFCHESIPLALAFCRRIIYLRP